MAHKKEEKQRLSFIMEGKPTLDLYEGMRVHIVEKEKKTPLFFGMHQNNPRGMWSIDPKKGIGHYVIIEAMSFDEAMLRAEDIGIDFEDACRCCGNRWYSPDQSFASPGIYKEGDLIDCLNDGYFSGGDGFAYIHYMDGTMVEITKPKKEREE